MFIILSVVAFSSGFTFRDGKNNLTGGSQERKISALARRKYSTGKLLSPTPVDSFKCLAAYKDVIVKLNAITSSRRLLDTEIDLLVGEGDATTAVNTFIAECPKTYAVSACGTVAQPLIATPVKTAAGPFTTSCLITEAAADSDDCYDSYEALIEALDPETTKIDFKTPVSDAFAEFVTQCLKTAQKPPCYDSIKNVVTTVGPVSSDLANIKRDCKIEAPTIQPKDTDAAMMRNYSSRGLMMAIFTILLFYFRF
jgi:hypothetical protein